MARIEVKTVDRSQGKSDRVDDAGRGDRGVPVLKLHVRFDGEVVSEAVVQADSRGVHDGGGAEVEDVTEKESRVVVVDLTTTDEKVGVGMELSEGELDFGAEEEVFLAADVTFVERVGAARLERRPDRAESAEREVGTSGNGQIFASLEASKGACAGEEDRELKWLACCGDGLCRGGGDRDQSGCGQGG